jgi:hypothetical protein
MANGVWEKREWKSSGGVQPAKNRENSRTDFLRSHEEAQKAQEDVE